MKKALVMNFFPAFNPSTSGGELRYYNFYKELSRTIDVTLLSPTYSHHELEVICHNDYFREYRVPKQSIHDTLHFNLDKEDVGTEISALVCALSAEQYNNYHEKYLELYEYCDFIIHDSPYMLNYDVFFGIDKKPRIYNSYNHETELVRQTWKGKNASKYVEYIDDLERKLAQKSDVVFVISEEEKISFLNNYNLELQKIFLAPNGIEPNDWKDITRTVEKGRLTAFFIGSAHPPNVEAVDFILTTLAPSCPDIEFLVAGACCNNFTNVTQANVKLLGLIDDEKKNQLFSNSSIAINPMFSGAGTNLKIIEYLAAGIPTVSTEFGARGLNLTDELNYFRATKDNFSDVLNTLSKERDDKIESIGLNGQCYILENFSWEKIVGKVGLKLSELLQSNLKKKPSILLLNDFEVSNPTSGGEIRINKLYSAVSKYYQVNMLCLNDNKGIVREDITDSFSQISVSKTSEHVEEEISVNSLYWISASDIVTSYMVEKNELLKKIYKLMYSTADLIILVHPYMLMLTNFAEDDKPFVYESLNSEITLKREVLVGHPRFKELNDQVFKIEHLACQKSEFIVSVSDTDHGSLRELVGDKNTEIETVKNGVEVTKKINNTQNLKAVFNGFPVVVFVGSGHPPNIKAARFIIEELAPHIAAYFVIIGTVCDALIGDYPDNVILFGRLNDVHKEFIMQMADVAVNPMSGGSGSNLKLADYMEHSLPTLTTSIGKRGYDIEDNVHAVISELTDFQMNLKKLLSDSKRQELIGRKARLYVKNHLSWEVLARRYKNLIMEKVFERKKKKLLVLTYRYTEPPLGGAETYLLNIIKKIDDIEDFSIDVATLDIEYIYNKFHFSNEYTYDDDFNNKSYKDTHIYKFPVYNLDDKIAYDNSKLLFNQWVHESIRFSLNFIHKYEFPILLGGWFYPEHSGKYSSIWSSNHAYIYTKNVQTLTFIGSVPEKKEVLFKNNNKILRKEKLNGSFEIVIKPNGAEIIELEMDPYYLEGSDPRCLGIRIESILIEVNNKSKELQLDYSYKDYLKQHCYEEYIEGLITQAKTRDPHWDELFQRTRGPLSNEMDKWLEVHIKEVDIVLGHSVPFNTTIKAVELSKKHNKPVVVLPHYHIDDEFYHWNSYYNALLEANKVIAAPELSVPLFYNKIGANTICLPGGAISKDEYQNIDDTSFRKRFDLELPFILVLGRKARSKNYSWVIDAVEKINRDFKKCNLVIVGKDEDGDPIENENVFYFGELTREEVLGALKNCSMLVTMSSSESFGIVILEAWMQKKPVIVNEDCPAFVELVQNGFNGITSRKEKLHEDIQYLLNNPAAGEKMGEQGYSLLSDKYTWESVGKEINNILKSLAHQN
ncbi:glycosyltransferase family 4 protein [Paenibacillus lautus]|uniref:glycosyltransferase family 4 protein n=2 Tax=Paenibacillus lautus TaxID=1401 RepID=UPI002FBDACC6